jgi:hypothetical protein
MHPRSLALLLPMAALIPLLAMKPASSAPVPGDEVLTVHLGSSSFGRSGALRTRIVAPGATMPLDLRWDGEPAGPVGYHWRPVMGTAGSGEGGYLLEHGLVTAPTVPGIYELELGSGGGSRAFGDALRVVVKVPFDTKRNGRIGPYHMGTWPTEGKGRRDAYAPPAGFIEVTEANRGLRLSENFTVGQFLTHDQAAVWPKYVAIDTRLIDKLELVLLELRSMGVRADRMVVMSGFRTPQYNHRHLGNSPSSLSRHQFGDAADVWVDNEGDWYMSDLNGDGRRDIGDARVMLEAVERVERRYPELVGGAGLYRANRVRGPFIHIDVRGSRARW